MPADVKLVGGVAVDGSSTIYATANKWSSSCNCTSAAGRIVVTVLGSTVATSTEYDNPSGAQCRNGSIAAVASGKTVTCPIKADEILELTSAKSGNGTYGTLPLSDGTGATLTQVVVDSSGNLWSSAVLSGSKTVTAIDFLVGGGLAGSATFAANADSGALSTGPAAGRWSIGKDIDYIVDCGFGGFPGASPFEQVTVGYPHDPATAAGGITSDSSWNAWFLDTTANALVEVPAPLVECPETASEASVLAHPPVHQRRTLAISKFLRFTVKGGRA